MSKFLVEEYKGFRTDLETGEITEFSEHKSIQLKRTEPFFQVYSQQILALYSTDVMNATTKVLYKMLEYAEWNTGKVFMTTDRVEEIMSSCNISKDYRLQGFPSSLCLFQCIMLSKFLNGNPHLFTKDSYGLKLLSKITILKDRLVKDYFPINYHLIEVSMSFSKIHLMHSLTS